MLHGQIIGLLKWHQWLNINKDTAFIPTKNVPWGFKPGCKHKAQCPILALIIFIKSAQAKNLRLIVPLSQNGPSEHWTIHNTEPFWTHSHLLFCNLFFYLTVVPDKQILIFLYNNILAKVSKKNIYWNALESSFR